MTYVCKHCGNKEDFYQEVGGWESFTATDYIDQHGNFIERDDYEWVNTEIEERNPPQCKDCDGLPEEISQEDWDNYIHKEEKKKVQTKVGSFEL